MQEMAWAATESGAGTGVAGDNFISGSKRVLIAFVLESALKLLQTELRLELLPVLETQVSPQVTQR